MRTLPEVLVSVTNRLSTNWATDLTSNTATWPYRFPLGAPAKADLETRFPEFQQALKAWRAFATQHHVILVEASRRVHGTTQSIPTHLAVPDIDTAAALAGGEWIQRLARGRERLGTLRSLHPDLDDPARFLRRVDTYTDLDFTLLLTVADWFNANTATGLTPRQVPIPGLHAKWLNSHRAELLALTGRDSLGLLPAHPPRIHFTYLDPGHRAGGGRWHDSATVGDPFAPAYTPLVVVISENKDTAIHFPELSGAIAIEGDGFGGKTAAQFSWIAHAPNLYYWGDIDAHGFEILNGYRNDGLPVTSILMDPATYGAYEPFGTNSDKEGKSIVAGPEKPLPHLTDDERVVYRNLCTPGRSGHRRIEQERIPLLDALDAVNRHRAT